MHGPFLCFTDERICQTFEGDMLTNKSAADIQGFDKTNSLCRASFRGYSSLADLGRKNVRTVPRIEGTGVGLASPLRTHSGLEVAHPILISRSNRPV